MISSKLFFCVISLSITYVVVFAITISMTMIVHERHLQRLERSSPSSSFGRRPQKTITAAKPTSFTVDILSVASINQLDLLRAQKSTIATHTSVRNFFNVTELDDADPNCDRDITWEHVQKVSRFCRSRRRIVKLGANPIARYFARNYARVEWLEKKKNPSGWLCAQMRPYAGLMKAFNHYEMTGQPLPNYFIVMDDDTYYNMELFQKNFEVLDSSQASFQGGCIVRPPTWQVNFTFPFGGFGSIISGGALSNLFRSVQCTSMDIAGNDESVTGDLAICNRLKENNIGELKYFAHGMSVAELMYKYGTGERYRDVDKWKSGFCMHSDWVMGYFVNYYNISNHVTEPFYRDVPHARMESYKGSEIYRHPTGFCRNDWNCRRDTEICHRASPEWMEKETLRWKLKSPGNFR